MSAKEQLSRGVLRREPCFKCQLPVFLAERLTIDGRVYHRTCLKCARCGHQLTPGSFYETEVDAEFCCEVCPDEEASHRYANKDEDGSSAFVVEPMTESLAIEKQNSLLKKSLSDEEKRESLEKLKGKDQKSMLDFIVTQFDGKKDDDEMDEEEEEEVVSAEKTETDPMDSHVVASDIISEDDLKQSEEENVKIEEDSQIDKTHKSPNSEGTDDALRTNDSNEVNNDTSVDEKLSKLVLDDREPVPCEEASSDISCVTKDEDEIEDKQRVSDAIPAEGPAPIPPNVPACKSLIKVPVVENKSVSSSVDDAPKDSAKTAESSAQPRTSEVVPECQSEPKALTLKTYPNELNPFGSDDDDEEIVDDAKKMEEKAQKLNPFDSEDEVKEEKVKPGNPFEDDAEEEEATTVSQPSSVKPSPRRTPVPTPRKTVPNVRRTLDATPNQQYLLVSPGAMARDMYGSCASLSSTISARNESHGSMNSLSSCSTAGGSGVKHKKGKAPLPPVSAEKSPRVSPRARKKRPAPAPPLPKASPEPISCETKRRLIPLDAELLTESEEKGDGGIGQDYPGISYRRKIVPEAADFAGNSDSEEREGSHERQWEKLKDNKDSKNRNRRSHISYGDDDTVYSDKSSHGKWKKRKGPAPALPVPPKRVLQMLPLQEILHELEVIEVQQQGLEKQGIMLEKIIRERCEGESPEGSGEATLSRDTLSNLPTQNTKEVEDLIMQLFDLVNEKNELFRRQAELMYLRRQHRLEQEQIDLEYEIRVLMAQPERNKTDSDKAKEEALISRLVEVVQLRNDVVDNLESDRLREAEEDLSIKQEIEKHTAKRDESLRDETSTKLSKKEKKKQKEAKKSKNKKIDVDKDDDETESNGNREKKKKKKFLII
ncbi:MICAL-like protein 1 isoform X2 [Phlebotomus papatasi]|uniref:MICAL-like protein 1 isoform X2 n=1 Tax=Phlebotomus papatasi TaxID=29031 RepID=UPI002483B16C|nr:MICAL-like protein 1 isoform X2 [Phlebotomus papatasi]